MTARGPISSLALVSLVLSCGQAGCGRRSHQDPERHPNALVVCPGATETSWTKWEGTDQLTYRAVVEYPADGILACISKRLETIGWRPLKEDYWNPGLPSSQARGWTQFADAAVSPEATVDQWLGQWENNAGDAVWYSLQYRYPPGDRHTLTVHAGLIPATIAKKMSKGSNTQK